MFKNEGGGVKATFGQCPKEGRIFFVMASLIAVSILHHKVLFLHSLFPAILVKMSKVANVGPKYNCYNL